MIAISAGHHCLHKGASYGTFNEHDEAIEWAKELMEYLGDKAVLVPFGFLRRKVEYINSNDIVFAVEIHFNSDRRHLGRGSETLYYPGSVAGRKLAQAVQDVLGRIFEPDRGIKEGYYQMNKVKGPDFFLAKTRCPAIIIEPEFIHHEETIKTNRQIACHALASALLGEL